MAYTTVFTKELVKKITNEDYMLSVNVVINDGAEDVKNSTYSVRYNKDWPVSSVLQKLQKKIKNDWDNFVAETVLYNKPAFDVMLTNLKTDYDNYINQ